LDLPPRYPHTAIVVEFSLPQKCPSIPGLLPRSFLHIFLSALPGFGYPSQLAHRPVLLIGE